MSCDCTNSPYFPGPAKQNLTITPGENVPIAVDWCAQIVTGGITSSTWTASPNTLTVTPQTTAGTVTSALVSSTQAGTLYTLTNTVTITPTSGGAQTYTFTANVYVTGPLTLG